MVRSPIVAAISYVVYNYSCRPQVTLASHHCPSSPARLSCNLSFLQSLPCSAHESAVPHVDVATLCNKLSHFITLV